MRRRIKYEITAIFILIAAFLSSCSVFNNLTGGVKIRNPEVDFAGARLASLSFDTADLLFDLKIRNPNPVEVKMAEFNYDFLINGNSFLKGDNREGLRIQAEGESTAQLLISLRYKDLYQTFQSLWDQDISTYQVNLGFSFELPVLGVVNIPLSKTGEFPLLKFPRVSLATLRLESLTLDGADLLLRVQLDNPNAFSMLIEKIQYQFEVNERNWISASAEKTTQVAEKGQGFIDIPISLDFIEMGTSVYTLLVEDRELSYQFGGKLDFATSLPLIGKVSLSFDRSGSVKLTR